MPHRQPPQTEPRTQTPQDGAGSAAAPPTPGDALRAAVDYYDANAERFRDETANLDLSHAFTQFLPHIPAGGAILDAGCGAGRDLRLLAQRGYRVEGFDASSAMARLAREHAGVPVRVCDFMSLDYPPRFHGIFANASLLHLPPQAMPTALAGLAAALLPAGVLYAGLKHGTGQWFARGLYFNAYDEDGLRALFAPPCPLRLIRVWTTADLRPGREHESWIHCLATK